MGLGRTQCLEDLTLEPHAVEYTRAGSLCSASLVGTGQGYPYWMFGALTMQNDQMLMNGDGSMTYFDAPATQEALRFWHSLGSAHGVMPSGTIEWGTLRKNFLEGKTAIM